MADPTVFIPAVGDEQLNGIKRDFYDFHKSSVDANFSVVSANGSVGTASSDGEATLALGAAQQGALAWMQSGGDETKYKQLRENYMNKMKVLKGVASGSLNPAARAVLNAQTRNFDRGAATAQGLGLNSASYSNFSRANNALAKKAGEGYFFNSKNEQFTVSYGNRTLQGKGYSQAQQDRKKAQPAVTPR
jgi:hypothetical protein